MHSLQEQQKKYACIEVSHIKEQQKMGIYPTHFSYPIGLQFELTSKCNLVCKHCYNSSGLEHYNDCMSPEDWKALAHDIVSEGGIFQAIISGGEPLLLGKHLFDFMDILHDDGTGFILITNGMLVRPSTISNLLKYKFFWVQVSIDDLHASKHDDFRGVKGSWDKAVDAAYLISGAGLPLRIAHSVTPENIDDLEGMIDFSYQLGASSIVCGAIMPSGRAAEKMNESLVSGNTEFIERLFDIICKAQQKYAGKMQVLNSADHLTDVMKKKLLPNSACVVRPNGDMRMDCTMPFSIGNVKEQKVSEIWSKVGVNCWNHQKVNDYISVLDEQGYHPSHKNHIDPDIIIS